MSASERFTRAWHVGTRTQRKRGEVVTTYLVLDGNGSVLAELPEDFHSHREQSANADLICDAVNHINGLRDLVRRLVSSLSVHHSATMAAVMANREEFDTPDFRKDVDADTALLREARTAIGDPAT